MLNNSKDQPITFPKYGESKIFSSAKGKDKIISLLFVD